MKTYLLLFTIGPVQSFISQARKAQDLYAGSKLLSDLVKSAIANLFSIVQSPEKVKLIFPGESVTSCPNRFLAKLTVENDEQGYKVAKFLEEQVRQEFRDLGTRAYAKLNSSGLPAAWINQIDSLLEIFWVLEEIQEDTYHTAYRKTEAKLGAVKNFRDFNQLRETGKKCSLCGERNALVVNKSTTGNRLQQDTLPINTNMDKKYKYLLLTGEGLCAVCFTKRTYGPAQTFASTATIATADTVARLERDPEGKDLLHAYMAIFGGSFDAQLFYHENLDENYFRKQGLTDFLPQLETAANKLKTLHTIAGKLQFPFKKYYAVLMFDGDNMGTWLSGEFLLGTAKQQLREFHTELTGKLSEFAQLTGISPLQSDSIVSEERGRVIYAGGDDFLGLINIAWLFKTLQLLRGTYEVKVNEPLRAFRNHQNLTFSAGIVIAHYKMPLSEVIKMGRNQEALAKRNPNSNKDAFSIAVMKHSGEVSSFTCQWEQPEDKKSIIALLESIIADITNGIFSTTFINNLAAEFSRVADSNSVVLAYLLQPELERLLYRSLMIERGSTESREDYNIRKKLTVASMLENIMHIHSAVQGYLPALLGALEIADFISRKTQGDV